MFAEPIVVDVICEAGATSMPTMVTDVPSAQAMSMKTEIDGFDNLLNFTQKQLTMELNSIDNCNSSMLTLSDVLSSSIDAHVNKENSVEHLDSHSFQENVETLKNNDASFKIFDLTYSEEEIAALNHIKVKKIGEFALYDDLHLIESELPKFLIEHTTANEIEVDVIANLVSKMASEVVEASGKESAYLILRTSLENPLFDIHRWHMDGPFYPNLDNPQLKEFEYKFITTLKGDPTLFYPLSADLRTELYQTQNDHREYWHEKLNDDLIITPKVGQGAVFTVGDPAVGAVHSEPKITQDRIFLSLVPGSKAQLAQRQEWIQTLDEQALSEKLMLNIHGKT